MLTYDLLHPQLLAGLAAAGHGDRVVLADGNFPLRAGTNPSVPIVHLNLRPGLVTVLDVLEPLLGAVPVEAATVMASPDGAPVPAHDDYARLLGGRAALSAVDRWAFYAQSRADDVALVVATADQRLCANLILTVGVRTAPAGTP
ncbi:L-fucose mutarotase [Kineococcus radiotolerans]|uniref:L-fucose mutarotase n=1 Tax=Kineococcus radiotolerans TaxID=131568 RepID=A0A7W4TMW0_KINRA|nr:RbsD/FucU family protein [Kineococcus radiotolerans]MBB2901883.1 L-fucose mutarotase [Kineococcus radiotolerans]